MITAARIRTGSRLERLAFLLALLALVAARGGDRTLAQRAAADSHRASQPALGGVPPVRNLRFAHLTTKDGLSQNRVPAIMQDRLGFMWFSTGEGLNRYDGHSFVVYKNDPSDPGQSERQRDRRCVRRSTGVSVGGRLSRHQQVRPQDRTGYPIRSRPRKPQQLRQPYGVEHLRGPPRSSVVRHDG